MGTGAASSSHGVAVELGATVEALEESDEGSLLVRTDSAVVRADVVLVAVGVRPRSTWRAAPESPSAGPSTCPSGRRRTSRGRSRGPTRPAATSASPASSGAPALDAGLTVDEIAGLDLVYAPPFAPVYDPILIAATVARKAVAKADAKAVA